MAKSMTGYGRSDFSIGAEVFSIEVKSLNHRFIDVHYRGPERFFAFENRIREEVKKTFARGSFSLHITATSAEVPPLKLNLDMARLYIEAAEGLKKELGVKGEADIATLLRLKDIFTFEKKGALGEADWEALKAALYAAFDQLADWRLKEGANLREDLLKKLGTLDGILFDVEAHAPKTLEAYRQKLKEEMERLIGGKIDDSRILLEAAIFAERTDINEETARLKSHLDMFRKFLKFDEPIGKKLDFLCQEIGREINTIGSKANDTKITGYVIDMKGEIEKIREQVQNVE
ncbi:MAG: YicC family protein [Deltaproteobacteria bacterium]|nr:YicC family protein [Deltaproteobacteria bacterium]